MLCKMPFRSRAFLPVALLGIGIVAALAPMVPVQPSFVTTNQYLVPEGLFEREDQNVLAQRAFVNGTIQGDLSIATGDLFINGTVDGDVNVAASGTVIISGEVTGSVRGAARDVVIDGLVGDDVVLAVGTVKMTGVVERDLLIFGLNALIEGSVGRDVKGQIQAATLDGDVGRDVDIAISVLNIGPGTAVEGDLQYRSDRDAVTSGAATVGGVFIKIPARTSFFVSVVWRTVTIIGLLAFLVGGFVMFWLFRRLAPRAVSTIGLKPLRSVTVGIIAVLGAPAVVAVLIATLVGIPVGLMVFLAFLLMLFFGPVPALTYFGDRVLSGRGGLFGAFVLGTVVWRMIGLVSPLVGLMVYMSALTFGVGAWLTAMWDARREAAPVPPVPQPEVLLADDVAPLPPVPGATEEPPASDRTEEE